MKKVVFLSLAISCAALAQQERTSNAGTDKAIGRLPAAYREAAGKYLHLTEKNLAHIEKESDQDWAHEAFATMVKQPEGRAFLFAQLEKETDGQLRVSVLEALENIVKVDAQTLKNGFTPDELKIVREHATSDSDSKAAAVALNMVYLADRYEENELLAQRRKLGDSTELREYEISHFSRYGEIIRMPAFAYKAPPLFTVVPSNKSVRLLAFGDFGTGSAGQLQDAQAMLAYHKAHPFDFGVTLGDNFYSRGVSSPDEPRWQTQWEQLYGPLGIKFYAVYGNHDYNSPDSPAAELAYARQSSTWVFPAPYYTYTAGAAQLFAIDTIRLSDDELAWLDDALSKSTAKWKIVYGHYHIYSATRGDNRELIARLLPILEKNHVQIYLNGHDHNMQEAGTDSPVHFFTSGAGGAGLYDMKPTYKNSIFKDKQFGFSVLEIDQQHVDVIFVDMDGKEVYRSHITK
ncbi:metallophosphoesterase [Edaphobacter modestus]|uniref:Calcineurin-like phosphoesterase family protein n=1 Tax=Edaphobacter modestus TaxID=388466 RepID=A0A4Q7Y1H3_9BACT|nr:metallophosphoesterase [Edaphobacter modestus]RZU29605.1 calcineurin-like phosphoesterase family protein [Edaphobacter modestus]